MLSILSVSGNHHVNDPAEEQRPIVDGPVADFSIVAKTAGPHTVKDFARDVALSPLDACRNSLHHASSTPEVSEHECHNLLLV